MKDKEIELERYIIKKGKTDLLSSLKALDKKLLKEKLEEKRFGWHQWVKRIYNRRFWNDFRYD